MVPRSWSGVDIVHSNTNSAMPSPQQQLRRELYSHLGVSEGAASPVLSSGTSTPRSGEMDKYLAVKVKKMGHILDLPDDLKL